MGEKKLFRNNFISFKDVSQGLKLTPQFKQAWNYIKKRNITDEMIESSTGLKIIEVDKKYIQHFVKLSNYLKTKRENIQIYLKYLKRVLI